ncbi:MAG: hypothetical protein R2720_02740 [Candidatus Nanopelagicales bacterium]
MWRESEFRGPAAAPRGDWGDHGRFLKDLLSVFTPETLLDLSSDGSGEQVVRSIMPTIDVLVAEPGSQADLVLVDQVAPDPKAVADGGIALVSRWQPGQRCSEPHSVLANDLAVIVPQAGPRWEWLLGDDFARWSVIYRTTGNDDEREFLQRQTTELYEALQSQTEMVEAAQRELLQARDEVQQLLPLELSPKAQLRALSRSVPVSVRKRLASYRWERTRKRVSRRDPGLARLKKVALRELLDRNYDQQWTGTHLDEYVEAGLTTGAPVSARHADMLDGRNEVASTGSAVYAPSTLVTTAGRSSGTVAELVSAARPELITVDLWDTLIVRRRPADAAKLATARRMVLIPAPGGRVTGIDAFEAMSIRVAVEARLAAADPGQEYELTDVLVHTLQELWQTSTERVTGLAEQLAGAEVSDEIAWTQARDDVAALAGAPSMAIASDFYMRTGQLAQIVHAAAPQWRDVPVYVSVDRKCSKRLGGGLLDLIRRDYHVTPQEHLHIGDNVHSDVDVQVAAGGMALLVQRRDEFPAPGEFSASDLPGCSAALRRELTAFDHDHPTQDQHALAGRAASPLAVAVVARGLEQAYRAGVDRVHYVSREGIFLAQVHELVEPLLRPPGAAAVSAVHLALSRRATFGASLEAPFRFSLQRMWSMYASQSVRAMLISIGVDPLDFGAAMKRAGLTPDEVLADARKDRRVEAFLADPEVEARIHDHVERSRSLLRQYVTSRTTLHEPFIVVDIGWRGTIQDNLVRALGIRSSIGVYLGLFPFLNAQPVGSVKIGVAFDGNLGEDFEFSDPPAVLERPWTPDVGSTVGFREEDGTVVPILDKESGHVSAGIAAFQAGTLEVAALVARWMDGFGLTTQALRPEMATWARQLWQNPLPGLADIWFGSDHDDSFGALNLTNFAKQTPSAQWLDGNLYAHVKAGMAASGWPDGYRVWRPVRSIIELADL